MAASSNHGTGAQNLTKAFRNGWADVSGIAFGPSFWRRMDAATLVSPIGTVFSTGIACGLDNATVPALDALMAQGNPWG
jgi:hypothetical protein